MTTTPLTIRGLTKQYPGTLALDGVDLTVGSREIVGLIGPNGAGKTTLFNCVSGFVAPSAGAITFGEGGAPRGALPNA